MPFLLYAYMIIVMVHVFLFGVPLGAAAYGGPGDSGPRWWKFAGFILALSFGWLFYWVWTFWPWRRD
jgi:hypothetical protein